MLVPEERSGEELTSGEAEFMEHKCGIAELHIYFMLMYFIFHFSF